MKKAEGSCQESGYTLVVKTINLAEAIKGCSKGEEQPEGQNESWLQSANHRDTHRTASGPEQHLNSACLSVICRRMIAIERAHALGKQSPNHYGGLDMARKTRCAKRRAGSR
ncbi:MAG: hypothetical protein PHV74_10775 [Dehalococcoidia bacterium]|nr:hypothetical protein [Dehalococcoidia bacterium]